MNETPACRTNFGVPKYIPWEVVFDMISASTYWICISATTNLIIYMLANGAIRLYTTDADSR